MLLYVVAANCRIQISAYSANGECDNNAEASPIGSLTLNGATVWQAQWCGDLPDDRGVSIFLIDVLWCTLDGDRQTFDTHESSAAATDLSDYLQQVTAGQIIVGVSGHGATQNLDNALPALQELGVDVADVRDYGSFAFVAQKGFAVKAVLDTVRCQRDSWTTPAYADVTVAGIRSLVRSGAIAIGYHWDN